MVLQMPREHNLYAKVKKCEFYQKKIYYLIRITSEEGIYIDLEKIIEAIMNWDTPRNVTNVRYFIGLARN